jgi:hypothetical protein
MVAGSRAAPPRHDHVLAAGWIRLGNLRRFLELSFAGHSRLAVTLETTAHIDDAGQLEAPTRLQNLFDQARR